MKHTKEPWRAISDTPVMAIYSETEDYRVVQTVNQNNFDTYGKSRGDVGIYKQADAERIVACVNACKGITTEALEAGIIELAMELREEDSYPEIDCDEDNRVVYKGHYVFEEE